MGQPKSRSRKKSLASRKPSFWLLVVAVSVPLVIIAALVLLSRENDSPDQQAFDPNFEPEVTGAPRLEVLPQDVIDYGEVKLGEVVTTVYTVRNVGDQPLTILGEPRVELVEGC